MEFTFKAELWEWQGEGAWCFVSVPTKHYEDIKHINLLPKKGFGSIRVEAKIGETTWKTSIFPDSKSKSYLLPVKKEVRKKERLEIGSVLLVRVRIFED